MRRKRGWHIAIALAVSISVAVLVGAWLHDSSSGTTPGSTAGQATAERDAASRPAATPDTPDVDTNAEASARRLTPATSSVGVPQAPVRLELRAPSEIRIGDVYEARIDIEANAPVRDLMFTIAYEKSRLSLVGRAPGEFLGQPGVSSEFGIDEPSDGYVEISFRAVNGSVATGSGTVVTLQFEAIRPGMSRIELQNVTSVSAGGDRNRDASAAPARVTIH